MEKAKSSTVAVQFQYNSHSSQTSNSFQDHHTLHTSIDDSDSKAGKPSTCKKHGKLKNTLWSEPPAPSAHVHKLPPQILKPIEFIALGKVQHQHNGRTSVNRLP